VQRRDDAREDDEQRRLDAAQRGSLPCRGVSPTEAAGLILRRARSLPFPKVPHDLQESEVIPKNTICLWYDGTALDAARFYAETFATAPSAR
jgi:hypothetical protein